MIAESSVTTLRHFITTAEELKGLAHARKVACVAPATSQAPRHSKWSLCPLEGLASYFRSGNLRSQTTIIIIAWAEHSARTPRGLWWILGVESSLSTFKCEHNFLCVFWSHKDLHDIAFLSAYRGVTCNVKASFPGHYHWHKNYVKRFHFFICH